MLRVLTVLFVGLLGALPLSAGGGGDGANGAGGVIWVLPNVENGGTGARALITLVPRMSCRFTDPTRDQILLTDGSLNEPVATLMDPISGEIYFLPVSGANITIGRDLLRNLLESRIGGADILVLDADRRGYVMRLVIDPQSRGVELRVY